MSTPDTSSKNSAAPSNASSPRAPKKGNSSHAKRLARAYAAEHQTTYLAALDLVRAAAEAGALPNHTDRDDMRPALDALRRHANGAPLTAATIKADLREHDESVPTCDECERPDEECIESGDGWCATCGMCLPHCQHHVGCEAVTRASGMAAIEAAQVAIVEEANLSGTFAAEVVMATALRAICSLSDVQSRDEFGLLLNESADELIEAHGYDQDVTHWIGDEGPRDAINLLVNAAMTFHDDPNLTLADVAELNYSEDIETILDWCGR